MPISTHPLGRYVGNWAGASITVPLNLDGQPSAGEYLIASVVHDYDSTDQGVTVDGFTLLGSNSAVRNAFAPWHLLFARRAVADEPVSIVVRRTVTTATRDLAAFVLGNGGVDTTTPLAAGPTFALDGRASGAAPGVTPAVAGSRALWFLAHQNYRAAADSDVAWTAAAEILDASSSFCVGSAAGEDRTDTTATGSRAWAISPYGGNTDSTSAGLALRPATIPANTSEAGRMLLGY